MQTVTKTHAGDERLITWEPPARLRTPSNGSVTRKRRPLNLEEAIKLLEAAFGHRRDLLFKLELVPGMREGEIIGLTWSSQPPNPRSALVQRKVQSW